MVFRAGGKSAGRPKPYGNLREILAVPTGFGEGVQLNIFLWGGQKTTSQSGGWGGQKSTVVQFYAKNKGF